MKIVFSRKGFDATYGGKPSPIFPDGRILSLPIPAPTRYPQSSKRFRDVLWDGRSLAPVVQCLSKVREECWCHLDPDLRAGAIPRQSEWRPAFGQVDESQTHLANQGVCQGDLFLFFGTFRRVEEGGSSDWRYVRTAPKVHLLFGWLQIHEVLSLHTDADYDRALSKYPWLSDHPHLNGSFREPGDDPPRRPNNTVYISTPKISIAGTDVPGGGVFGKEDCRIILTEPDEVKKGSSCRRKYWRLPEWFWPADTQPLLSYHRNEERWRRREPWVYVDTVGRGQELVFDADGIQEANVWLRELFM